MSAPAGFVEIGKNAVHIAFIRRYSSDVQRFIRCLPVIERMRLFKPGSAEWGAIASTLDFLQRRDVERTFYELASVNFAMAEHLKAQTGPDDELILYGKVL